MPLAVRYSRRSRASALARCCHVRYSQTPLRYSNTPTPLASLAQALCQERTATCLRDRGFAVLDDAIDDSTCDALCADIDALHAGGLLLPNEAHHVIVRSNGSRETVRLPKVGMWEIEASVSLQGAPAHVARALRAVASDESLLPAITTALQQRMRLTSQSLKAQLNVGSGGCFPPHVDSDAAVDSRLVTVLLYPGPSRPPSDGSFRLFPFPFPPVEVPLRRGRAVVFPARRMLHSTLPAVARRHCVTLWLSGAPSAAAPPDALPADAAAAAAAWLPRSCASDADAAAGLVSLLSPPSLRLHTARWCLADAYAEAYPAAFGSAAAAAAGGPLERHGQEIRAIEGALAALLERRGLAGAGGGAALLQRVRALLRGPLCSADLQGAEERGGPPTPPLVDWWRG